MLLTAGAAELGAGAFDIGSGDEVSAAEEEGIFEKPGLGFAF